MRGLPGLHRGGDAVDAGVGHRMLAHGNRRRLFAAADARRGDHAHVGAQDLRQLLQQLLGAGHLA
jgi:hypothetical protein